MVIAERNNYWMLNWLDEYMIGHKGFICGGCFKNIFSREKVKDLDVFFRSREDFDNAVHYFETMTAGYEGFDKKDKPTYVLFYENVNVKAYKNLNTGIVVELCCKIFGTPEEILNQFDFTITKFAYYSEEVSDSPIEDDDSDTHIEYRIVHHKEYFEHLHFKRLVTDDKIPFPMSTYERLFKYARYGYFPCRETKLKIIKALREVPEELLELSNSFYDGWD